MSALGVYYVFSYVFVINYLLMDKKGERLIESELMNFLLTALICWIACPMILSSLSHKMLNKLEDDDIEDDAKKIIKDNL